MKSKGFGVKVVSNTSHLNSKLSVAWATISIRGSYKGNWVVSFL